MKSPIITTIALFITFSSLSTLSLQAQSLLEKKAISIIEVADSNAIDVNSDITNYLSKKLNFSAKGDRVGNGFSLKEGGEVVGIISENTGNGAGNFAIPKHRGGNG
ncbi:MAG: hypothetical protein AAFY45_23530 [Bacteroidota bacterium]